MQSIRQTLVILGTGGTIAGRAASPDDAVGYRSAAIGVEQLVAAVPSLAATPVEAEQIAQIDSKDMTATLWVALASRMLHHLARPEVAGIVVTHGTDTLEETAYALHRLLGATAKPVVLTAAMRPATALGADGPRNLADAAAVGRDERARGVLVVFGARVFGPTGLRKVHGYRVDAFDAGDDGPLGAIEEGGLRVFRAMPEGGPHAAADAALQGAEWPVVEILTSHAGARAATVDALVAAGARGLVIAGTGNGTVHAALDEALRRASARGVTVWRASRCLLGGVVGAPEGAWPSGGVLTPYQARIELQLELLRRS
jgi:L-asparaginase